MKEIFELRLWFRSVREPYKLNLKKEAGSLRY